MMQNGTFNRWKMLLGVGASLGGLALTGATAAGRFSISDAVFKTIDSNIALVLT